jgi:hypothetical protein
MYKDQDQAKIACEKFMKQLLQNLLAKLVINNAI